MSIEINLKMTISELILTLPPDTKSLIRSIENTNRKRINIQLFLVFNKTCIQENLLPAYTCKVLIKVNILHQTANCTPFALSNIYFNW